MAKRTGEQIAADVALTAAIDAASQAYYPEPGAVMMEYVVALSQLTYDDDGEPQHSFTTLYRDGDVSSTRALGLLIAASDTLRHPVRVERDDD